MAKPMTVKRREKLKVKIRQVCGYIVRGRNAADSWSVRIYHLQRILAVVLSVLGGAGVIVVQNGVVTHNGDLITTGGILALATGILSGLYQLWDTEKTAVLAISARDAFDAIYDALEIAVKAEEPAPGVNQAKIEAELHLRSFGKVIKMKVAPPVLIEGVSAGLMAEVDEKGWHETEADDE
jgi:hypothetical protein